MRKLISAVLAVWLLFAGAAYFWEVLDVDHETYVTGNGTPAKETLNTTILSMTTNTATRMAASRPYNTAHVIIDTPSKLTGASFSMTMRQLRIVVVSFG